MRRISGSLITDGFESADGSPTADDGGGKGRHLDQELISKKAGLAFPIRDGIPIMLIDEARSLND